MIWINNNKKDKAIKLIIIDNQLYEIWYELLTFILF